MGCNVGAVEGSEVFWREGFAVGSAVGALVTGAAVLGGEGFTVGSKGWPEG